MKTLAIFAVLLHLVFTLKFSYNLIPKQTQCFYEIVQRDSRFQIIIRSSSPQVVVNIFTPIGTIANLVDPDVFEKSYAGFSDNNNQVHFCISNPTHQNSKSSIQFYHGLNLETIGQVVSKSDFSMLKQVNQNLKQIVQLIKHNFKFYSERIRARVLKHQGVSWIYNIITILLIIVVSVLSFYHVFSFRRFLRLKKYI